MKSRYVLLSAILAFVFLHASSNDNVAQIPESLEGKIDMLGGSVAENEFSRDYFIKLGPDVVPIVTQKLLQSLSEGASPEAGQEKIIMQMPLTDQKRVRHQIGLIAMQSYALRSMALSREARKEAEESLYKSLKSPYIETRKKALYSIGSNGDISAVGEVIPLLNDPDLSNRVIAAQMLVKIGDASTAAKIEAVLEQRRQGLTAEQIEKDWSFRHGYEAIKALKSKVTTASTQAQATSEPAASTTPSAVAAAKETPAIAETKSPSRFSVVPLAILAAAIVGVVVFLLKRKGT